MTNDVRLAAKVTAHTIRIRQLEDALTVERAANDQLRAHVADLQQRLGRIERAQAIRSLNVARLRARLREARNSRDLWRYRYRRDVA